MNKPRPQSSELPADFYEQYEDAVLSLGSAKATETMTDGLLDVVLCQLMRKLQDESVNLTGKSISIEQQKRDAKCDPKYLKALAAHAKAQSNRVIAAGRVDQMKMTHDEWRTRSANQRSLL